MRHKLALCVGINDYPGSGSDLSGCVNDANDWAKALQARGYEVKTLLNSLATKANILLELRSLFERANWGDRIVFQFSGHGTWVPDKDGDEADQRDEALCCYDYSSGGLLTDDELHSVFQERNYGVRVTVFSDSCHSGTMARLMTRSGSSRGTPKFLSPSLFTPLTEDQVVRVESETLLRGTPRSGTVLISGCADTEYSYDASFGNRPNGAMTYFAIKSLDALTTKKVYETLRTYLPIGDYPQTPQLTATSYQKYTNLL